MATMAKKKKDEMPADEGAEGAVQVLVRMAPAVRDQIKADAEAHFRSVNMHILWLIHQRLAELASEKEIGDTPFERGPS